MLFLVLVVLLCLILLTNKETFDTKIPCKKWPGDIENSPANICKDCGYPEDCHGPYMGESWRHIFKET